MIPAGLGVDSVEIDRIARSAKRPAFLAKVFTPGEVAYASGRAESLAAAYAAKEAFSKALGCGLSGICLREVEVVHDERGAPSLALSGETEKACRGLHFLLSLTHDRTHATAAVFAWREAAEKED